ncbi:hypothetical protein BH10ACT11_BH10ACT11_04650 [soil metagenome]
MTGRPPAGFRAEGRIGEPRVRLVAPRRISGVRGVAVAAAAAAVLALTPQLAAADQCLTATAPAITKPAHKLRFGITPQLAGTVCDGQGQVVPESAAKRSAALAALKPKHRTVVIRLNRLFESDGWQGIKRFERRARRYGRAGFEVESQVRYHPKPGQEGDMPRWRRYVRNVARELGKVQALTSLTITNEVNLPISANTSDGAYPRAVEAIVKGVPAARRALDRIGRGDVSLGLSYAYRYIPSSDEQFWQQLGELGGPEFRRSLDYVGVQLYPGLFYPPALTTQSAGEATIEAMTLVRSCFMPQAHLGAGKELWISENGYATNLGHDDQRQDGELDDTVRSLHAYSGTLGISDYRYFNLRDNRPGGTDLFDDVGLLRADYTRKPAFATYRGLISRFGSR